MPCPTCNHTMQNLGLDQAGRRSFWCPRCGTVKTETRHLDGLGIPYTESEAPSLIRKLQNPDMHLAEIRKELAYAGIAATVH